MHTEMCCPGDCGGLRGTGATGRGTAEEGALCNSIALQRFDKNVPHCLMGLAKNNYFPFQLAAIGGGFIYTAIYIILYI